MCVDIQASGEAHSLQRQPWDQTSDPGAVPYTSATEGGVYTTSASQTEGQCGKTPTQVSLSHLQLLTFVVPDFAVTVMFLISSTFSGGKDSALKFYLLKCPVCCTTM